MKNKSVLAIQNIMSTLCIISIILLILTPDYYDYYSENRTIEILCCSVIAFILLLKTFYFKRMNYPMILQDIEWICELYLLQMGIKCILIIMKTLW